MFNFGVDNPLSADSLPSSSEGLDWFNNNRKRLLKLAKQYINESPAAVKELLSQGQTDTSNPQVIATRQGFNELRVRLPVLNQYYEYSNDTNYLAKVKTIVLAWVDKNTPTGKPIDETNFEGLLRVIKRRWDDFDNGEQSRINAWLLQLKQFKENWSFTQQVGEGPLIHGNHYTHHYKILWLLYEALDDTAAINNLRPIVTEFATRNLPFGNTNITYPVVHNIVGTGQNEQRFDIDGNFLNRFPNGHSFSVNNNSQGNNGQFTVISSAYLSGSDKTRIVVAEPLTNSGGGGNLQEHYLENVYDMPRAATDIGETIDYIRRDALHYHQYDMEPWLELAIMESTGAFQIICARMFTFLERLILNPPVKHYEFTNSSDSFDALRWESSRSEYLQPESMYIPDKAARVIFAYLYFQQQLDPTFEIDSRLLSFALRSDVLPSHWYYYFRWVFRGAYG